jgi:hypothetical protein
MHKESRHLDNQHLNNTYSGIDEKQEAVDKKRAQNPLLSIDFSEDTTQDLAAGLNTSPQIKKSFLSSMIEKILPQKQNTNRTKNAY